MVGTPVGVNHLHAIGHRVLAEAEKLYAMPDGVRGLKDGVL